MKVEYVKDCRWANAEKTKIDVIAKFQEISEEIPFTADIGDVESHGQEIFSRCIAGDFGIVLNYTPPADITGDTAKQLIREQRNNLLTTQVDPVVSNPLRWASLSEQQKQELTDYRLALLNITTTNPNPVFTWNETKKLYESNVTWPTKPNSAA